jgi:GNAT superfamily N-acetyltransferase
MAKCDPRSALAEVLTIRRLGLDDFSDLRHVHATALLAKTAGSLSEAEVRAFVGLVYSPAYSDLLLDQNLYGGWIEGQLVGTAAWSAGPDEGATVRIGSVFVSPLFTQLGIGRQLVVHAEECATQCGFTAFSVCSTTNAVPFFTRLGYQTSSYGVKALTSGCMLPVAFMRKAVAVEARSALTYFTIN